MLEITTKTSGGRELKLWLDKKEKEMKATIKGICKNRNFYQKEVKGKEAIDLGKVDINGNITKACVEVNEDIAEFIKKAKIKIKELKEKEKQEEVVFEVVKTKNSGWTPNWNVLDRKEDKLLSDEQYEKIQELRNVLGETQLFAGSTKHIDVDDLPVEEGETYTLDEIIEICEKHSKSWQKAKQAEKEKEEHYQKCLEDAKRIGEKVEVENYSTKCNDSQKECSTDIIKIFVTPNGEKVSERIHTY